MSRTIFFFLGMFFHLTSGGVGENENNLICVVGGGISGLNVATLLQKRGYRVAVFEKESRVGGKVETFRQSDQLQVEMCPLFFGSWCKSLIHYIDKFQLTPVPYNDSDKVGYDVNSALFHALPQPTISEQAELRDALLHYLFHRSLYEADLEFGYVNSSPDLFVSMLEWLEARKLDALVPILTILVTIEGYGPLEEIPALYILKFLNSPFLLKYTQSQLKLQGSFLTLKEGLDVLVDKMASSLNVFVNMEVSHIVTEKNRQQLFFTQYYNKKIKPVDCSKTILAFTPLFSNINKILYLSPEEKQIFQQVRINKYTSAANYIPSLNHFVYVETFGQQRKDQPLQIVPPTGQGEVVALLKQNSKKMKNIYSSYSWIRGSSNSTATKVELFSIQHQLQSFIQKIDKKSKILHQKSSEYFPHVSTKSLQQGFYKKFDKLQGKRNLYYATTLLGFETLEDALAMTKNFVERYF